MAAGSLGAIAAVTSSADQMSSDATDGAVNALTSLAEQLQPAHAFLAGQAVSSLLGATEAVAHNGDSSSENDGVARNIATAERGVQLSNVLESVTVSLASDLVDGEQPATVETDRFKLSAHVGRADINRGADLESGSGRRRRLAKRSVDERR